MAITLRDIRTAVQNYLDTHVGVSISGLTPAGGVSIQPNEVFTFSVTANNSSAADAIRLVNVRYHIRVLNPAVAKLVVPSSNPDANGVTYKSGPGGFFSFNLAPNAEVGEMFLFPPASGIFAPDKAGDLDIGDIDTIAGLKGKAGSAPAGGSTSITCAVLAEADLDFLFPKNEDSASATRALTVVG